MLYKRPFVPVARVVAYRMLTTMYFNTLVVVTVACFFSGSTHGQRDDKFFREDYTYIEKTKSFYKIHTTPRTWNNARRLCAQEGASLFYPENSDEVDAVLSFWNRTQPNYIRMFVGMSELLVRGVFETIEGKQLSEVFNKWVPGEPSHSGGVEHCVNLYKEHGAINDCPCDIEDPFICKKTLQSLEKNYECHLPNLDGQGDNKFFRKDYTYIEASKGFYKIHTTPRTWNDARRLCAQEGASLFYPENSDEVDAVISFWNRTHPNYIRMFVGMSELLVRGVFETIDGKQLSEVFNIWVPGEPSHSGGVEHCVNLYKEHGAINDCPCDIKDPFICKKTLQSLEKNYERNLPVLDGQGDNKFFRKDYTYIEASKGFYKIHTTPRTWNDARRLCAQEGASLFYPENSDEVDAVLSFWNRTQPTYIRLFLGMSELMVTGIFETIDGKLLSEVFNKWVPGEPSHSGGVEHCVNLYKEHGAINDCPCDIVDPFICEKSLQSLEWNHQCNMPYLDYYPGEGTSKCYKLHTTPLTWIEAYNMCRIEESSLAMINNQLEAGFLANFTEYTQKPRRKWNYQRGIYHLGFHNRFNDGWQTVKGTPINLDADAWWDDYQPEAGDPDGCGAMLYTGRLINISCDTKSFFICEHDVDYSSLPQEENLFQ